MRELAQQQMVRQHVHGERRLPPVRGDMEGIDELDPCVTHESGKRREFASIQHAVHGRSSGSDAADPGQVGIDERDVPAESAQFVCGIVA